MKLIYHALMKFTVGLVLVLALLFLSIPVVLGSWWALLCFAPYVPVIIVWILNEEKVLAKGLAGYAEYQKRVKYRLIPFIF